MRYNIFFFVACIAAINFSCTSASELSSDKLEQEQKIRHFVESQRFTFSAGSANPANIGVLDILPNGNQLRNLTTGYFLTIMNDSLSANLPYFGRAYSAPIPGNRDNSIKVNSKQFSYSYKQNKKDVYLITIKLNNDESTTSFTLDIGLGGYATLQVQSINRDPISFYGTIQPLKNDIQ